MERSLVLFKPDIYERRLQQEILAGLEELPLERAEHFLVRFTPEGVFELWPRIYGWRWTDSLMRDFPSRPLDVHVLVGPRAAETVIDFKDGLRERRSQLNSYRNMLHSPDGPEAFQREYRYLRSIKEER